METKCMLAIERKGIPFDCSLARGSEVGGGNSGMGPCAA